MSTTDAGRLGEAKVIAELVARGWYPFIDVSGKCPVDIIAWKEGVTITVQVKSTSYKPGNKYQAQIGSIRPNRSGNGIHKFDNTSCDYLAIYVAPENRIAFIKASDITVGRSLTVQEDMFLTTLS